MRPVNDETRRIRFRPSAERIHRCAPRRLFQAAGLAVALMALVDSAAVQAIAAQADAAQSTDRALREARKLRLEGKFDEAIRSYEALLSQPDAKCAAAAGLGDVCADRGDHSDGLSRLDAHEASCRSSAAWHESRAALLATTGEYESAIHHNREALRLNESSRRARWQLGQVLERTGKSGEAVKIYKAFDDEMSGPSLPSEAEATTYLGLGFYRYSVLTRKNLVQRTRHVLDEVFGHVSDFVDTDYWPARLAAAELLLEKHNLPDAGDEFKRVRYGEQWVPDAAVGLGRIHLERWDFDECEAAVTDALATQPGHVGALLLMADLRMTSRRYAEAAAFAERALKTNPRGEEALGVLAAAKTRMGEAGSAAALLERVRAFNDKPARFHFAMGQWQSAARQYPEAESHFKKAIEYAPAWPEPRTSLGQLYMETGDERAARKALEAAFELDSFNQHTFNVLGLLDRLAKFARIESDHFIVKYDAAEDEVAAIYFSRALESIHEDVCAGFEVALERKTIIEIFSDHEGFSVRITGRPFIGTIGACTGNVIAMTAPRGRPPFGRFNWASVLRHEFTHTVTLAATENRIPHWLTEGLAVHEEPAPRSWTYKQLLSNAVRRGRLFTLESIDWGFARPKRAEDRSQAYAQSEWMVEYIIERWRYPAILKLLKAFRERQSQPEAFQSVLGISTEQFDADFREWATREAGQWGLPIRPIRDLEDLAASLKDSPDDARLHAELSEAYLLEGEFKLSLESALQALKIDEKEPLAVEVVSRLYVGRSLAEAKEPDRREWLSKAEPYILRLSKIAPENPIWMKYKGYLEQADEQWSEAVTEYKAYQQRVPTDPDTYRRMAAIHLRRRQFPQALQQLESLFRLVEDEPAVARQIARLYEQREDWSKAAHWYLQSIYIDPYDVDTHGALADVLMEAGQYDNAEHEYQIVVKLLPDEAMGYEGLARAHEKLGNPEKARLYQKRAEALAGGHGTKP